MASGTFTFGAGNKYIEGRLRWNSSSNGSVKNSSNVTVYLDYKKSSASTAATYGDFRGTITINGNAKGIGGRLTLSPNNSWVNVGSHTVTVGHNNDGKKNINISGKGGISGLTFQSNSGDRSITLDKIPRYADITSWKCTGVGLDYANFSWKTNASVNWCRVYLNNAGANNHTDNPGAVNASSGNFKYTGKNSGDAAIPKAPTLRPNTVYNLKLEVRRSDSGLWRTSGNVSFTTKPIATITNSNVNFDIGNNLTINFKNHGNNKSFLKLDIQQADGKWKNDVVTVDQTIQAASYTWELSKLSTTLYSYVTTRTKAAIRVRCGTVLNGTTYEYTTNGTMSVVNSKPTFSAFTIADIDTVTQNILGNKEYMFQNYGNMRATITAANKAKALNSAKIVSYTVNIYSSSGKLVASKKVNESTSDLNINMGTVNAAGTYTLKIYATDSRGLKTGEVPRTFYVLPYIKPRTTVVLSRHNGFENEVFISLTSYYSKILLNDVVKNDSYTIKYRYQEVGGAWGSYVSLADYTLADSGNDFKITFSKQNVDSPFLTLDNTKSYNFEFVVTDKVGSVTTKVNLAQGIPVFLEMDNGYVSVGKVPDFNSPAKFQTATDIMANGKLLLGEIDKKADNERGAFIDNREDAATGYWHKLFTCKTTAIDRTNICMTLCVTGYYPGSLLTNGILSLNIRQEAEGVLNKAGSIFKWQSSTRNMMDYLNYFALNVATSSTGNYIELYIYNNRQYAGYKVSVIDRTLRGVGSFSFTGEINMSATTTLTKLPTNGTIVYSTLSDPIGNMPKMVSGTMVRVASQTAVLMLTRDQIGTMLGISRPNPNNITVIVNNGDGNSADTHIQGATWLDQERLYAVFDRTTTGKIRINYTIIYNPVLQVDPSPV